MQADELVRQVEEDRQHGASELAFVALQGVTVVAHQWSGSRGYLLKRHMLKLLARLGEVRPSMIALQNLLNQLAARIKRLPATDLRELQHEIAAAADAVVENARLAQQHAAGGMADLISPGDVVMTYSVSSTMKLMFNLAEEKVGKVYVPESRPGNEGALLAAYLSDLHLDVHYITEAQVNLFMPQCDKVIVGADAVLSQGDVVNKAGTSLLALSAHYHHVPFYVCAERFKNCRRRQLPLEAMDPVELGMSHEGVSVHNVYFDITPTALVTRRVS